MGCTGLVYGVLNSLYRNSTHVPGTQKFIYNELPAFPPFVLFVTFMANPSPVFVFPMLISAVRLLADNYGRRRDLSALYRQIRFQTRECFMFV
jgi:hypothetical protein